MQFNDTTNLNGICQEIDFLLGTNSTDYPLKEKTRNINRWNDKATSLILQADNKMEFDDANFENLPVGTMDLIADQQDYSPNESGLLKILKVECKDSVGGWNALKQIDKSQFKNIAMDEYRKVAGIPVEFDLTANSFILYPKPNYSSADGLKIHYQRIPDYFEDDDEEKEPGFAPIFHRYLSLGASLDYAMANSMYNKVSMLQGEISKMEVGIIEFYSSRDKDFKNRITLEKEDYSAGADEPESVDWSST